MTWLWITLGVLALAVVSGAVLAWRAGVAYGSSRGFDRGVAEERKRATLARLNGRGEWEFRLAEDRGRADVRYVVYARSPDGDEYTHHEYAMGINSLIGSWVHVASGKETSDPTLDNRFYAWRVLQASGAR